MKQIALVTMLLATATATLAADFPALNSGVKWLETERLRGVLFHDPTIEPMRPRYLLPPQDRDRPAPAAVTVVGESYFALLPDRDKSVACEVTAVSGYPACPDTIYALFDDKGQELATWSRPARPCGSAPRSSPARARCW